MANFSPSFRLFGIRFGVYSREEILKLSVKEITNPSSFDALGHPTYGGLYDPALGTSERSDVCITCGQNSHCCPGHMGHITLPLPVYNPVLFKTLFNLLRGTCFQCHAVMIKKGESYVLQKQMEMLEAGIVTALTDIRIGYNEILTSIGGMDEGNFEVIKDHIDKVTKQLLSDEANHKTTYKTSTKNINQQRQLLLKEFLNGRFFEKSCCPHCKNKPRQMRSELHSRIFFSKGMKKSQAAKILAQKQRKKSLEPSQEETEEMEEVEMDHNKEDDKVQQEKELAMLLEQQPLTPFEVRLHLRQVWQNDSDLLQCLMGAFKLHNAYSTHPTDMFFLDVVPVPAPKFRPISVVKEKKFDNKQSANLANVVTVSQLIKEMMYEMKQKDSTDIANVTQIQQQEGQEQGNKMEKLHRLWLRLQTNINCVVDSDLDKLNSDKQPGIKQLIEKKQGLFRKHMMGKRVNFAARSVISPDPYINTNEIGIPDVFAKKLTYPQPVTHWNYQELKQAVINGPDVHPGAWFVINEDGHKTMLSRSDKNQREAIAKQLLAPSAHTGCNAPNKKVLRHLKNGDVLLLNRQPTLHKPSIQAHRARILPGEKTLRLHYSNCKAYNADFDGDEMNAHFPQNEIARAEAYNLAGTDYQYLVPKDGTPLAGLIQDHMIGGVHLTIRGRFFNRQDYQRLVYDGLTDKRGPVKLLPPTILKPQVLWSGKQVLSTVVLNVIPADKPPVTLEGKAKVAGKNWLDGRQRPWSVGGTPLKEDEMSESQVIIHQGELLVGVLDKAHYGNTPYGLIHSCYELYGGKIAGLLLTAFAKLFTKFLQIIGFTLGVEDILCIKKADKARRKIMKVGISSGPAVVAKALNISDHTDSIELTRRMQEAHLCGEGAELKDLDLSMKGNTDEIQNKIAKAIMPVGLVKKFPKNNLQLMVQAGAKGSSVNCMQISCLLGQIELEGRRPPLMMSGQFLPSFVPYDPSPRAGGFVDGRFLTGIRPQEYFFHCMAGREGLVDTAVKTSRSGYLQRCIIKHLEGLTVNYDLTVRDADGSIVQFEYGEDSLDIPKTQFLKKKQFPFLIQNQHVIMNNKTFSEIQGKVDTEQVKKAWKKVKKWQQKKDTRHKGRQSDFLHFCHKNKGELEEEGYENKNGRTARTHQLCSNWQELAMGEKQRFRKYNRRTVEPVVSSYQPHSHLGSVTEKLEDLMTEYAGDNPQQVLQNENKKQTNKISVDKFKQLIYLTSMQSLVHPGEAVGLLAAQSIGEPSTQMTLNTFHFAGRGEMNVTLGIPRLREILMVASAKIKTPAMDVPVLDSVEAKDAATNLKQTLTRVHLSQVLEDVYVTESLSVKRAGEKCRLYKVHFNFLPHAMYKDEMSVTPRKVLRYMEHIFLKHLQDVIKKKIADLDKISIIATGRVTQRAERSTLAVAEDTEDVEDDDLNDGDTLASKYRDQQREDQDYTGEEMEKEEVGDDQQESEGEIDAEDNVNEEDQDSDSPRPGTPPTPDIEVTSKKRIKAAAFMDSKRVTNVLTNVGMAKDYSYDPEHELWCEVTLRVSLGDQKLDMLSLVEKEAKKAVVFCSPGISRAFLIDSRKPGEEGLHLKTEGVNIQEMYRYDHILNLNKLYTNDIHALANTYGIEAASKVLIKEMRDVFAAYGIEVDYHHLSLIADYMTFEGVYKPFNRIGIESNPSPLQKMTFETTMSFLKTATLQGATDELTSPSSRLVVGRVVAGGTGCFDLLQPLVT